MNNGNFWVSGCYSVMYLVELLSWLDNNVVDELLLCFKGHLKHELEFMVLAARNRTELMMLTLHHYNASKGSFGGIHSYASSKATHKNQINESGLEQGGRQHM